MRASRSVVGTFHWFIPSPSAYGVAMPFPANATAEDVLTEESLELRSRLLEGVGEDPDAPGSYARVVYLSPMLEDAPLPVAVAAVAFQLAHLVFEHRLFTPREVHDRQVGDAEGLLRVWGFEAEIEALERERRESAE